MLYDEEHGEYCKYKNGVGPGDVSNVSCQLLCVGVVQWCFADISYNFLSSIISFEPLKNISTSRWTRRLTYFLSGTIL